MAEATTVAPAAQTTTQTTTQNPGASAPVNGNAATVKGGAAQAVENAIQDYIDLEVNGKSERLNLKDPQTLSRIKRDLQITNASAKNFQESSKMREEVNKGLQLLRDNTAEGLRRLGVDPEQFAKTILEERIRQDAMNPEQRAAWEAHQRALAAEAQAKQLQDQQRTYQEQQYITAETNWMDQNWTKALSDSNLPRNTSTIRRMIEKVRPAVKAGMNLRDFNPFDLVSSIKDDIRSELSSLSSAMSPESLIAVLGEENAQKIAQYYAQKIRNPSAPISNQNNGQPRPQTDKTQKLRPGDWSRHVKEMWAGR